MRPHDALQIVRGSGRPSNNRSFGRDAQAMPTHNTRDYQFALITQSTTIRQTARSGTFRGQPAMYSSPLGLIHLYAESRQRELLAEAEHQRKLRVARGDRGPAVGSALISTARRIIGVTLVRVGERVQGVGAAPPRETFPNVPLLRLVR